MVFTTNKPLSAWGRVLHDHDLAAAILDRVLERGRLLELDGPSLRTKHLGLDDPTAAEVSPEPARVSGKHRPEFPEPTYAEEVAAPGVAQNGPGPLRRPETAIPRAVRDPPEVQETQNHSGLLCDCTCQKSLRGPNVAKLRFGV